ncbi:MAG TPA: hypothetical protein VFR37_15695 [Longimicrobium sp.]|nr:hypothetical protein [Longimicrobium sp.]
MPTVTVTFAGMCLLVPTASTLHVLMPHTDGHPHHPRLVLLDNSGKLRKKRISGLDLDLTNVTGAFTPAVQPEIFNFDKLPLGARKVPKALLSLGSKLPDDVRTRVRLKAGKAGGIPRLGGAWNFPSISGPIRLPTAVNWDIQGVTGSHLTVVDRLSGETFEAFPNNSGVIKVLIVNVTANERDRISSTNVPAHSQCRPNGEKAVHFKHYADLLDPRSPPLTLPAFDLVKSRALGLCPPRAARQTRARLAPAAAAAGGSELTCMVTTAPPR